MTEKEVFNFLKRLVVNILILSLLFSVVSPISAEEESAEAIPPVPDEVEYVFGGITGPATQKVVDVGIINHLYNDNYFFSKTLNGASITTYTNIAVLEDQDFKGGLIEVTEYFDEMDEAEQEETGREGIIKLFEEQTQRAPYSYSVSAGYTIYVQQFEVWNLVPFKLYRTSTYNKGTDDEYSYTETTIGIALMIEGIARFPCQKKGTFDPNYKCHNVYPGTPGTHSE